MRCPVENNWLPAAANNTCVRFNLAVAAQWQTSEQLQTEWFACVINGKQAETFCGIPRKVQVLKSMDICICVLLKPRKDNLSMVPKL